MNKSSGLCPQIPPLTHFDKGRMMYPDAIFHKGKELHFLKNITNTGI